MNHLNLFNKTNNLRWKSIDLTKNLINPKISINTLKIKLQKLMKLFKH